MTDAPAPLYSIGTWDNEDRAFTPQDGMQTNWCNVTLPRLRTAMQELQGMGYSCHRTQDGDSDPAVMIERTDGVSREEILKRWRLGADSSNRAGMSR